MKYWYLKKIYQQFSRRLAAIKGEQEDILKDFQEQDCQQKIEDIRKKISNNI